MNLMFGNQIFASDVDQRIISLQIFQNQTLPIIKFTGTRKILKLVRTDKKIDTTPEKLYMKVGHRRYTRLCNVCILIQKVQK